MLPRGIIRRLWEEAERRRSQEDEVEESSEAEERKREREKEEDDLEESPLEMEIEFAEQMSLAARYWNFKVLGYDDKISDGFYDLYVTGNGPASINMPSLIDLRAQSLSHNSVWEAVLVHRGEDPELMKLEQKALSMALELRSRASELVSNALVQQLASFVCGHMGGLMIDAWSMSVRYQNMIRSLKTRIGSVVVPLGQLKTGVLCHRALLFKVLADSLDVPCQLVKGTDNGLDADAVNIVKFDDGREFIVDLAGAPGTLVPVDGLKCKDSSFSLKQFFKGSKILLVPKLSKSASYLEPPDGKSNSHGLIEASVHRMDIKSVTHNVLEDTLRNGSMEPTNVPFALLQDITDNFSDRLKIASGGFGEVYKGVLQDGITVAVKKLLDSQTFDDEPFYKEANSLMNVKHQNVVRFLGFCAHTENEAIKKERSGRYDKYIYPEKRERLLCFEYISGGSLDKHVADELRGLEWHTRYQIIKGICQGLEYLHKEMRIVHMDLKPQNILLDDLTIPKITDFGISRHLDGVSQAVTKKSFMSMGYCAPEYIHRGEVSFKCDIYSLGVIITELVTGRKVDPDIKNVLRRWRYRWNKSAEYPPFGYQQVTECIAIAVSCMSEHPKRRPFIWDIVSGLNSMDSMNEHISNANESTVGQISPYDWELLEFDKLELQFPFELNKQIPCSLQLTNERDDYIAFEIQATNILQHRIEPNKGVVPPRSKCNVIITLQAQKRAPCAMLCKDDFDVRCAVVNEGLTAENITEDMFDEKSGKVVDEVNLTVAF